MRLAFRGVITAGCIFSRARGFLRTPPFDKTKATCASPAAAMMSSTDGEAPSRHHPSALRNRALLRRSLGSGSVEARGMLPTCWRLRLEPGVTWKPLLVTCRHAGRISQQSTIRRAFQTSWLPSKRETQQHTPPVVLDVCSDPSTWPRPAGGETAEGTSGRQWDAIVCSNMIHISPQECTGGLLGGAAAGLKVGGHLFVYGPFALNGLLIPDSNKDFDVSLKARSDGSWGIRDAAWVCGLAYDQGLELTAMTLMPANNFFVVFTKVREAAAADVEDRKARVAELVAAVVVPAREALVAKVSAK